MGNCGHKAKLNVSDSINSVSTSYVNNQMNSSFKCPQCNFIFTSDITLAVVTHILLLSPYFITQFNNHIQNCGKSVGTVGLNDSFSSTIANKPKISETIIGNCVIGHTLTTILLDRQS